MTTSASSSVTVSPQRLLHDVSNAADLSELNNTRGPIRLGFWVLVVGFGLFLLWACFAPLDEGVTAPATVSVETHRKTIQHGQGGVVKKVLVKDGAEVKAGDVLIELDDGLVRATLESVRQNYIAQRALENRLVAELASASSITFHPDLKPSDPIAAQHMAVQQQVFVSRRAALNAELGAYEQQVASIEQQEAGLREMLQSRRTQQSLQGQQLASVRALADEGYAPRNQALQMAQTQAELVATISDMDSTLRKMQIGVAELRLRVAQRRQEFIREVSTELAAVRREVNANEDKLQAVATELDRMQIKSPVTGQVIALQVNGIGGVVQPGQRLMDILPHGEQTLLDVRIHPQFIDRAKVGGDVEVRFSAFSNTPHLVVTGKLISLAGDAITEPSPTGAMSYYMGRVALTPEGLKNLGDHVVQPGMTAEVLIRTGERSLMTYMLHPLTKRIAAAMTEE